MPRAASRRTSFLLMGVKGMWVQWIWGFPITVFYMAYMGKWICRSGVMTGAEWMRTMFGDGAGGQLARHSCTLYAVLTIAAFLAYGSHGMGKFGAPLLVWVAKGLLLDLSGPEQLYDFQRFLAVRDSRDACKLEALWGIIHTVRWPMAMALVALAIGELGVTRSSQIDAEQILPLVIDRYLPGGFRGLALVVTIAVTLATAPTEARILESFLPLGEAGGRRGTGGAARPRGVPRFPPRTVLAGRAQRGDRATRSPGAVLFPIYLVIHRYVEALVCMVAAASAGVALAFTRYRRLPPAGEGA